MPNAIAWRTVCTELKENDVLIIIECLKTFKIGKSQAIFCTLCALPTPHLMCYKILNCRCTLCKQTAPYAKCPRRAQKVVYLDRKVASLFELGEHVARAIPPHSHNLTPAQKDFAKQICMEAARIHTAMLLHFGLRPSQLPALQKVQNVVCYYRRTKLGGNDTTAAIVEAVQRLAFNGGEEEHDPFTFGWEVDREGKLVVGNGSDEKSFLVGFSTKALLHQASRDPSTFIFHVDATYKTNQVSYPVFVVGITDIARKVSLLVLLVTSQQQECHYAKAFAAIRWIYSKVLGEQFRAAYVMGTLMLPRTILLLQNSEVIASMIISYAIIT
ncbi:hypothetical protein F443_05554 [Phytophthora nicotianae P1569]|uniref:MULE transposase domain-containing protein n=1 Tax=Phytophthora nicotianae P1569 TaxID=1317065 RepID=V9FIW3_PHYNI|nr:hypothetical protein F443_05554 [Phytophthora nicotianae P1569]